ncbi:hypothetical protein E1H12_00955 [Geitlerinema sp. P-1104]|uniref:hypothetical protein n=1 Tax=Geitlerinema sp. P-1104 TaxID=2546230 RepID=UPI001476BEC8|nr:hypothetical protein [Geitlerinema sp. P-1104]NMG57121.1 hypothetical protein [Geitlerinema sp. P-1104]
MASDYFHPADENPHIDSVVSEPTLFDDTWDDAPTADWDVPTLGVSSILSEQRAQYGDRQNFDEVWEPLQSAPPDVQEIMRRVLTIELRRLNTRKTYGVTNEILKVVYDVIPE